MSLCRTKIIAISLELVDFLSNSAKEYCKEKDLPEEILPELLGAEELGRFTRGLNLKVEVKQCLLPRPEGLDVALETNSKQKEFVVVI